MKITIDENIPYAKDFFGGLAEIQLLPGREIKNSDLVDSNALIVRSVTRVNQELLTNSSVGFVGTCTIGTDHLDVDYLDKHNIRWTSAPGCNAISVVEYVLSALSALNTPWITATIGIVGCGNVGGALYRKLKQLGVECCVYDPFLTDEQCPDLTDLETVLQSSVICLHTPLTKTGSHPTYHMLGDKELDSIPSDTTLINAGRGAVIDNEALYRRLSRCDLNVVLDVWEGEPEIQLTLMERVAIATPHIAGYSFDGKVTGTEMVYNSLCQYMDIAPLIRKNQILPELEAPALHWSGNRFPGDIYSYIRQSYDILSDDKQFRSNQLNSAFPGKAFDQQRKTYPARREFGNYYLPSQVSSRLKNILIKLGFAEAH